MSARLDDRPVGAFDSGVGGLTVVQAMRELLPSEDILYLGDKVKAVVVACNTASAHALAVLQKESDVPVIGVIAPGVEAALAATRNRCVGIIGTQGTIQSGAYQNLLLRSQPDVVITAVAAPLLVSLVEEDWLSHPATRLILEEYLAPMKAARVDTVVLACTHYPLLKILAQEILGPGVVLVDSAQNAAGALARQLKLSGMSRAPGPVTGSITICATDLPPQFSRLAERFLGEKIEAIRRVSVG
jgi:glutamate racemase